MVVHNDEIEELMKCCDSHRVEMMKEVLRDVDRFLCDLATVVGPLEIHTKVRHILALRISRG
jgi:hypothetical protein